MIGIGQVVVDWDVRQVDPDYCPYDVIAPSKVQAKDFESKTLGEKEEFVVNGAKGADTILNRRVAALS